MNAAAALGAHRLVVKIGSSLLVEPTGELRAAWLEGLAQDIAVAHGRGQEVIIVTSGAIALGWRALGLSRRPVKLEEKQASAAAGQILLARAWAEALAKAGLRTAQLLVTLEDTEARRRYLNARATVSTLLRLGAVPVVNENDTVATSEIRFGDNDRLSARVAVMATAETLVLLSDVDGLYTADPKRHEDAVHLAEVVTITPEIERMAGDSRSGLGTGGMASKIEAARIAVRAGCTVLVAKGTVASPLSALATGARCTIFRVQTAPGRARKDWIGAKLGIVGTLHVDAGAAGALRRGSSLLPAGVTMIDGPFERGDAVMVRGPDGAPIAKGLVGYDAGDAARIAGRHTDEIETILGYRGRDALIHRDDLVLL